jgi:hypothetical protein
MMAFTTIIGLGVNLECFTTHNWAANTLELRGEFPDATGEEKNGVVPSASLRVGFSNPLGRRLRRRSDSAQDDRWVELSQGE